jgi:hypothetical protein
MASFFQEVRPHRGETIDEHTCFQALATMFHIGFHVQSVAGRYDLGFVTDGKNKLPAGYKSGLGMVMAVFVSLGSLVELYLDQHDLSIVPHDLTGDTFTGGFPCKGGFYDKIGTARFHSVCFLQKYEKKERLHLSGAASLSNEVINRFYC